MKIEKILAGVDFGPATDSIMAYAGSFAYAAKASLHLLHVLDYVVTPPAYLAPYIDEEKRIAESSLAVLKKELQEAGITTGTEIVIGRLHESFAAALTSRPVTQLRPTHKTAIKTKHFFILLPPFFVFVYCQKSSPLSPWGRGLG